MKDHTMHEERRNARPLFAMFALALICGVAGCGGGNGGSASEQDRRADGTAPLAQGCATAVGGGDATVTWEAGLTCAGCTVANAAGAIDDDPATFALAAMPASASTDSTDGALSVRATAQPGITFPAGYVAGVWASIASAQTGQNELVISTYLGSQLQEQTTRSETNGVGGNVVPATTYYAMKTGKPFNAVEITQRVGAGTVNTLLYEFCADGA